MYELVKTDFINVHQTHRKADNETKYKLKQKNMICICVCFLANFLFFHFSINNEIDLFIKRNEKIK